MSNIYFFLIILDFLRLLYPIHFAGEGSQLPKKHRKTKTETGPSGQTSEEKPKKPRIYKSHTKRRDHYPFKFTKTNNISNYLQGFTFEYCRSLTRGLRIVHEGFDFGHKQTYQNGNKLYRCWNYQREDKCPARLVIQGDLAYPVHTIHNHPPPVYDTNGRLMRKNN